MPSVAFSTGNIFASNLEALVNPVDCSAAMGAGLAKPFAGRFRKQCAWFKSHGQNGFTEPGQIYHVLPRNADDRLYAAKWVLDRHREGGEALVLFATTKAHWRRPSELRHVIGCLSELVRIVPELGIRSIGIHALGCGLGGLQYADVRPLMVAAAEQMQCERVVLFEPKEEA
jgi:O-acetyl-ADP-ribose deacetylase (regulator of RNase III)